jgi:hypothetical protein
MPRLQTQLAGQGAFDAPVLEAVPVVVAGHDGASLLEQLHGSRRDLLIRRSVDRDSFVPAMSVLVDVAVVVSRDAETAAAGSTHSADRLEVEAQSAQRAGHEGPASQLMFEARMIAIPGPGGDHCTVVLDLSVKRLGAVETFASEGQNFDATGVVDPVLGVDPVPETSAGFPQGTRRFPG